MTIGLKRWGTDQRYIAGAMLVAALLYALAMTAVEMYVNTTYVRTWSLMELSTEFLGLGGLSLAIVQLKTNWSDTRLRNCWLFATGAMVLLTISEANDWLSFAGAFWDEDYRYKLPLWLSAALALFLCTRLYRNQVWVRRFLLSGFVIQSVSNFLDIADGDLFQLPMLSREVLEFLTELTELFSLQCYVAALAFTFIPPARLPEVIGRASRAGQTAMQTFVGVGVMPPPASSPIAIGALARSLYGDLHLFRAARYPTRYPILHTNGFRQIVTVAMAVLFGARIAPRVAQSTGRSIGRQFLDLLVLGLGQGIDAVSYYLYELYRPRGRREAAYYLTRYETKNGLFTALNALRPRPAGAPYNMTDKAAFADACKTAGIPTPAILLTIEDGRTSWHCDRAALDRDLFVKLKRGRGTMHTGRYCRVAPWEYVDRDGNRVGLSEIIATFERRSLEISIHKTGPFKPPVRKTTPFIVQARLHNHPDLADLAWDSLVVVRVVTCLNHANEPEVTHAMLRVLTKIEPQWDTAPDWEYGAAIDLETGRLGQFTGDKPDTCLRWYDTHPVTGAPITGRIVSDWPGVQDLALRAHRTFASRIVVGWDLALTSDGPMMLEGNSNMDVSFIQRAYRTAIGRSRLGELLGQHLNSIRRV